MEYEDAVLLFHLHCQIMMHIRLDKSPRLTVTTNNAANNVGSMTLETKRHS